MGMATVAAQANTWHGYVRTDTVVQGVAIRVVAPKRAAELAPGPHTLRLRVAATANPKSKGTAVRIVHFLVNGS